MNADKIESRASDALTYLTDTDELAANLKFEADKAEASHEKILATLFLHAEGSVELRKAKAKTDDRAENARLEWLEAHRKYDAVANKRRSEAIVVEWLRSLNANRRQGQ